MSQTHHVRDWNMKLALVLSDYEGISITEKELLNNPTQKNIHKMFLIMLSIDSEKLS